MRDAVPSCGMTGERNGNGVGRWNRPSSDAAGPFLAEMSTPLSRAAVGTTFSRVKYTPDARRRTGPGAATREDEPLVDVLVGPPGRSGRPPWSPSGSRHPSRGPRRRGLSKSVAKAPIESKHRKRIVGIPRFLPWSAPVRSAFATDSDTPPLQTVPGSPPAPPRAHPSPSPHRFGPTDPSLPVRKAQPLPARRLDRFRWSPDRFRRLFEPISLTAHLIPVVVEADLAAWRRLLRPSASATPLHPSLYEKKEHSKGRRSVVVGKERSRGGGTRWWVVENGIVAMKDEAELRR